MDDRDTGREAAIKRLKNKREFQGHLVIYLAINTMLVVIWAMSGAQYFWPMWPILGWGISVALHAWVVYGRQPISEDDIRQEMKRDIPQDSQSTRPW